MMTMPFFMPAPPPRPIRLISCRGDPGWDFVMPSPLDLWPGGGRMRIVVVGTSGAGKTTLARRIAALLELPHIELDAINWQAGWRDLTRHDPEEFLRRVDGAIEA